MSNHHNAPQIVRNTKNNCNEQFLFHQKALLCGDLDNAKKVLEEPEPAKQKQLGCSIANYSDRLWKTRCLDLMKEGLYCKFTQNEQLKAFLLNTGSTQIIECNPRDSYWGTGLSMENPRVWQDNSWQTTAQNHLGRLLMDLRLEFNREEPEQALARTLRPYFS